MTSIKSSLQARSWTKDKFLVSTNPDLVPIPRLIEVFDSDDIYWANAAPPEAMREMLTNSLVLGLYESVASEDPTATEPHIKFIGLARCITDYVTFAYLTDVWVDSAYRGTGLGSWLIECVREILDEMPYLRRTMLLTGDWERSVPFYEKLMGMSLMDSQRGQGLAVMRSKGRGHPSYGHEDPNQEYHP